MINKTTIIYLCSLWVCLSFNRLSSMQPHEKIIIDEKIISKKTPTTKRPASTMTQIGKDDPKRRRTKTSYDTIEPHQ